MAVEDADEFLTSFCHYVDEIDISELREGKRNVCENCKRPITVCWCPYLPREPLEISTSIYILQHPFEESRTLRTVPMLVRSVANDRVTVLRGKRFPPKKHPQLAEIMKQPNTLLLYPCPDAINLSQIVAQNRQNECHVTQSIMCCQGRDGEQHNQSVRDSDHHMRSGQAFCENIRISHGRCKDASGDSGQYPCGDEQTEPDPQGDRQKIRDFESHDKICSCTSATVVSDAADSGSGGSSNQDARQGFSDEDIHHSCTCELENDSAQTAGVKRSAAVCSHSDRCVECCQCGKSNTHHMRQGFNLVILDGTWAQAKGIYCQNEIMKWPRKVQIQHDEKSKYVIRTQPTDGALSTLETAAVALAVLENRPELIEILTRPLVALCEFQIAHGAVKHHSREYKVENGLWTKPLPRSVRRRLEQQQAGNSLQQNNAPS